jgi:hypothetical protein
LNFLYIPRESFKGVLMPAPLGVCTVVAGKYVKGVVVVASAGARMLTERKFEKMFCLLLWSLHFLELHVG